MTIFHLPDLGEGLTEAEIVTWHVAKGDHVTTDQPLLSVETEKAVVEIPSPHSGRIKILMVEAGDVINVGAPLVEFYDGKPADTGTVVGEIEAQTKKGFPQPDLSAIAVQTTEKKSTVKAAPAVRAYAQKMGVELTTITPTGHAGEITREDVEEARKSVERWVGAEKLRSIRRIMARNMAIAQAEVARATVMDDADIDAWKEDANIMTRLIRAIVYACKREPSLNAWYDHRRGERLLHKSVNLGIAVDTVEGLFVPLLKQAEQKSAVEVKEQLERLKSGIDQRTLAPDELRGHTISLSNFGSIRGRYGELMIVPPQVAIIGAGRVAPRVIPLNDTVTIHNLLPLSLAFDHRAVTGAEAARFLEALILDLQKPN